MFRLRDAIQRYRAQQSSEPNLRLVAASGSTLSPYRSPGQTRRVATVAAVATPGLSSPAIDVLLQQLREEGTTLQYDGNVLSVRPARWEHLTTLDAHWQSLLAHLKTQAEENDRGPNRSA
ncbi:MAG: hypothetical protein ACRES5_24770 [Pseudomonas sp.]